MPNSKKIKQKTKGEEKKKIRTIPPEKHTDVCYDQVFYTHYGARIYPHTYSHSRPARVYLHMAPIFVLRKSNKI
jgi:hypothetical protein